MSSEAVGPEKEKKTMKGMGGTYTEDGNPFAGVFQLYGSQIDSINEKRERIVKAARDIRINSKKAIFSIHRQANTPSWSASLDRVALDLLNIRKHFIAAVAAEMKIEEEGDGGREVDNRSRSSYWRFQPAFSAGVQEYVEALVLLQLCREKEVMTWKQVNDVFATEDILLADGRPFFISIGDYLLGLADVAGEVMRLVISSGGVAAVVEGKDTISCLLLGLQQLRPAREVQREMKQKLQAMKQTLTKLEMAAYTVHMRGAEYPPELLELIGLEAAGDGDDERGGGRDGV
eukprot:TRINITY_DN4443_c0_g4_i1.p1 TRINITY_DN4443_c0_g4~~TRINITY_DN4443_c0_g4_i1.p1  ORF type:complete len:289 (+),score=116.78 TRINITY_DN4443_c0_g4_i1:73-939(+)